MKVNSFHVHALIAKCVACICYTSCDTFWLLAAAVAIQPEVTFVRWRLLLKIFVQNHGKVIVSHLNTSCQEKFHALPVKRSVDGAPLAISPQDEIVFTLGLSRSFFSMAAIARLWAHVCRFSHSLWVVSLFDIGCCSHGDTIQLNLPVLLGWVSS